MSARDKLRTAALNAAREGERSWMGEAARLGLRFLYGFLMSLGRLADGGAPFGIAAVAESGAGREGAAALSGVCLGYFVSLGLSLGLRYVAASVLCYTVLFMLQDSRLRALPGYLPVVTGASLLAASSLGLLSSGEGLLAALPAALIEAGLAGAAACIFKEALSKRERATEAAEARRDAAIIVLAACAMIALSNLRLFGVLSIGRLFAVLFVMASAQRGGPASGAAAGTAFGIAMDAAAGGAPFYAMAYALSGLISGMVSRCGRLSFLVAFILADSLAVLCTWAQSIHTEALFEVFSASVIFMLIPPSTLARLGALYQPLYPGAGESGLRRYASRRVEGIARAYGEVCGVVRRSTEPVNDNDISRIFDRAADTACLKCKRRDECWTKNYMDTLDALNAATRAMSERGRLEAEDIPERFRENCTGLAAFVAAVNGELRAMAYRRQYQSRMEESRAAAWALYEDFADILRDVSHELGSTNGADPLAERRLMRYLRSLDIEADAAVFRDSGGRLRCVIESGRLKALTSEPAWLDRLSAVLGIRLCRPAGSCEGRLTLLEAEPLAVSVGVAAMKKKGESVSGDRGTYFKTDSGSLCIILSDGMGAGEDAARESIEAVSILERFLRCGVDPAIAMKILNSVMLLRNGDEWGFATVDLMCVDLFSGETCFYKYGAAPSYVRNGKNVRRVCGESLAAGLMSGAGAAPDVVRMRLKPGSLALIASDGVVSGEGDEWLREMLRTAGDEEMKALARRVLRRACDEYGNTDDMTVLAVRVDARL